MRTLSFITLAACVCIAIAHSSPILADMDNMAEQFQCLVDVMEEASTENGMKEMWTDFQQDVQLHVDNWKQCINAGNEIEITRCTIAQMTASQYFFNEYLLTVIVLQKLELLQEYLSGIRSECGVRTLGDEFEFLCWNTHCTPRFCYQCLAHSMGESMRHYGMNEMWAQFKSQLHEPLGNWKCDHVTNTDDVKACHAKHSKVIYSILNDCTALMSSMNPKILIDFKLMVRQRCENICINFESK